MRRFLALIGLIYLGATSFAQTYTDLSQQVPFDNSIRTGVLPNGLTYYIKQNNYPQNLASFYIYQNVGAALETDKQDGLAHFLEHMAFNGTNTFPGKSMLNMLEKNGMKFGRDINAYTTRNETVYNISRVPTSDENLIDSCLIILHDWCDNLELSTKEIDAERGVISEEWRSRRNVQFRTKEKTNPLLYNNTIYAQRDVIGDLNVIKNFDYSELRSFYHEWYRTDLQAVAVVGDIDVDAVEKKVIKLFSAIPAIENPKKRPEIIIPDAKEAGYIQVTDPEYKEVGLSVSDRYEAKNDNTLQFLRDNYVRNFFISLINQRIIEKQREGHVKFTSASIRTGYIERGYNSFEIYTSAKPENIADAYAAIYSELQRVIKFGFTDSEVERIKTNSLTSTERGYNGRDKIDSDYYCKLIKSAYLYGNSVAPASFNYEFAKEIIPTITKEEVAAVATKYFTGKNRNYIVTGPTISNDSLYINQAQIEAIMHKVENSKLEAYVEKDLSNESLMSIDPVAGKIIKEKKNTALDATEWTLSNGVKVIFKQNTIDKGNITLLAQSEGGSSLYGVEDLPSYTAAARYIGSYGLGSHNPDQLKKMLTGKAVSSDFKLSLYNETVSAGTSMGEIETMMQLTYMRFREPRFDNDMFNRVMKQTKDKLKTANKTAEALMKDTISTIEANGNPRSFKYNEDFLNKMDFNRMVEIYKERFANPADFTFFIVGDITAEELKPYVEKYIASIEAENTKKENWKAQKNYFPKGKNVHNIQLAMEEPKATVILKNKSTVKYSGENNTYLNILGSVLNLRYTENIREKEGGTYGVSVSTQAYRVPKNQALLNISFNCDPEKADHLKTLVYKELDVAQENIQQNDLDKVILNMKKNSSSRVQNSAYWLMRLTNYYQYHDLGKTPEEYNEFLSQITTEDIQKIAKRYFKKANTLDFVILPKE